MSSSEVWRTPAAQIARLVPSKIRSRASGRAGALTRRARARGRPRRPRRGRCGARPGASPRHEARAVRRCRGAATSPSPGDAEAAPLGARASPGSRTLWSRTPPGPVAPRAPSRVARSVAVDERRRARPRAAPPRSRAARRDRGARRRVALVVVVQLDDLDARRSAAPRRANRWSSTAPTEKLGTTRILEPGPSARAPARSSSVSPLVPTTASTPCVERPGERPTGDLGAREVDDDVDERGVEVLDVGRPRPRARRRARPRAGRRAR